jgi:hypothetical protein
MALFSAYLATMVFVEIHRSAIKLLKKSGAAIAPCGTLSFIVDKVDQLVWYRTSNFCLSRCNWKINQTKVVKFVYLKDDTSMPTPGQMLAPRQERQRCNIAFFPVMMKLYPLYD